MTTAVKTKEYEPANMGSQCPFHRIDEPGVYVSNWDGHLVRVPEDALKQGRSPVIEILGREPLTVTKLHDDPFLAISKARMIAADLDISVNF